VYSQEELVAEMGAAFLGMEVDIVRDTHEQSAAYLQSWLEVLRAQEHKRWIINAASQATKAADFILNRQRTNEAIVESTVTV
jgi:antirestriction protein ArdC